MGSRILRLLSLVAVVPLAVGVVLDVALLDPRPAAAGSTTAVVQHIAAALVDRDMHVRAVPLLSILIAGSGGDTLRTRTGTDGTAAVLLPPGTYTLWTPSPTTFEDRLYDWRFTVVVKATDAAVVQLSNDNANVVALAKAPEPSVAAGRMDESASLFNKLSRSVCLVQAGLTHGSGFLADTLGGVILTNAHVAEMTEPEELSVVFDGNLRMRAQLLALDSEADIAVLRVSASRISGRTRVPLQRPGDKLPLVPGERLIAMGFPLHQDLTMTTGIVSNVRAGAVISDVNINPGNSGGPLLNVDGEAVAINTFADVGKFGAGVAGSILISRAGPALSRAAAGMVQAPAPSSELLPVIPLDRLEIATLKAYADTTAEKSYRAFAGIAVEGFDVTIQTPAQTFIAVKKYENEVAKDRKKREAAAGLTEAERYSQVREYRDWTEYVGMPNTPVVSISVIPRIGETGGSVFARMMLGPGLQAKYKFKADVKGVHVFRNEEPVEPIHGGHAPNVVFSENQWISLKDVADQGFYVYDVELLRPDSTGAPPSIVVAISDLKHPKKLKCCELPAEVVAQAWNEFRSFYAERRPGSGFRLADAKAAKDRKPAWKSGFLKGDADWTVIY